MLRTSFSGHDRTLERSDRAELTNTLIEQILNGHGDHDKLIDNLIEANMPVAGSIAAGYRRRGVALEDLEQVAYLALVRVAHSFDPSRGRDFLSYAVPSIRGEVRRYFRDHGWMVRPPRSIQETQGRISAVESELSSRLGRPPTVEELATELGERAEEVEEAMAARGCFTATSLDHAPTAEATTIADRLGEPDPGMEAAEARVVLAPLMRRLTGRERRILQLRFVGQRTQQEIANDIGVTQMQVSRLLAGLMRRLHSDLADDRAALAG